MQAVGSVVTQLCGGEELSLDPARDPNGQRRHSSCSSDAGVEDLVEVARLVVEGSDAGPNLKGPARFIHGARRRAGDLLDGWLSKKARQAAEEVEVLLHAAELEIGWARHSQSSIIFQNARGSEAQVDATKEWIVETFTEERAQGRQDRDSSDTLQSEVVLRRRNRRTRSMKITGNDIDLDEGVCQALGTAEAQELLQAVGTFDFDALSFAELFQKPLCALQAYLMQTTSLMGSLTEQRFFTDVKGFARRLFAYMEEVDGSYMDVPYHNRAHAADVMMAMEWFLRADYFQANMSSLDQLMGLVAAAIHDIAHPGRNNLFFSKTMAPLAVRYNDRSILENMHLAFAFDLLEKGTLSCNWFQLLSTSHRPPGDEEHRPMNLQHYVRRGLIDMVLATDMAKHAKHAFKLTEIVDEVKEIVANGSTDTKPPGSKSEDQKLFLLGTALHAADISNTCKTLNITLRWTERVLMEFWAQGDEEKRLGLEISPMCDREAGKISVPKGQIGFITFVVHPYYSLIKQIVPEVREAITNVENNKAYWESKAAEGATPEQIFGESTALCQDVTPPSAVTGRGFQQLSTAAVEDEDSAAD